MNKNLAIVLFLGVLVLINTSLSPDGSLDRIADARGVETGSSGQHGAAAERRAQIAAAVTPPPEQSTAQPATSEDSSGLWDLFGSDDADEESTAPAADRQPAARPHSLPQASTHVPRSTTEGELSREQLHLEE